MPTPFELISPALVLAGCLALGRGREWLGGAFLGIASALTLSPAAFLPYLVWRARPQAAVALVLAAGAIGWLAEGAVHHPATELAAAQLDWISAGLMVLLVGTTIACLGRPFRALADPMRHLLECSAVVSIAVFVGPDGQSPALLLLPALVVTRRAVETGSRPALALAGLGLVGALAWMCGIAGASIWLAGLSLIGCWVALLKSPARAEDDRPTTPPGAHWRHRRRRSAERDAAL